MKSMALKSSSPVKRFAVLAVGMVLLLSTKTFYHAGSGNVAATVAISASIVVVLMVGIFAAFRRT